MIVRFYKLANNSFSLQNYQPLAEKPWSTFMGRLICVPDMPIEAQKHLGIFDNRSPGKI